MSKTILASRNCYKAGIRNTSVHCSTIRLASAYPIVSPRESVVCVALVIYAAWDATNNQVFEPGVGASQKTLALFVASYSKLYLSLQELVPESESVRASTPPKTMASSIETADANLQASDFSNRYPK